LKHSVGQGSDPANGNTYDIAWFECEVIGWYNASARHQIATMMKARSFEQP